MSFRTNTAEQPDQAPAGYWILRVPILAEPDHFLPTLEGALRMAIFERQPGPARGALERVYEACAQGYRDDRSRP